jgi:hypothetical protein
VPVPAYLCSVATIATRGRKATVAIENEEKRIESICLYIQCQLFTFNSLKLSSVNHFSRTSTNDKNVPISLLFW